MDKYNLLLEEYYKQHGNIDVPFHYEKDEIKLGAWLSHLRQAFKNNTLSITLEEIAFLNNLGMKWNLREEKRKEHYKLVEEYYKQYGNIDIPLYYEKNGIKLGIWLKRQRQAYKKENGLFLTEREIAFFNSLGMNWELRDSNWDNMYYLLEEYYNKYGDIDIKTIYVVNNIQLGNWLVRQKCLYKINKLGKNKIQLLNDLNIDWSKKDTNFLNSDITIDNVDKYKIILNERLNHILDDMIYDDFNKIDTSIAQKEIQNQIIKKLWR